MSNGAADEKKNMNIVKTNDQGGLPASGRDAHDDESPEAVPVPEDKASTDRAEVSAVEVAMDRDERP